MNERRILLFIFSAIIYCLYSVHMWFVKEKVEEKIENIPTQLKIQPVLEATNNETKQVDREVRNKVIPLFVKNACSVLEVFTQKPSVKWKETKSEEMDPETNTFTVIGITVFLVVLALNALLDVLKVKEEERARRKLNPDGVRRKSLAEFANKKTLRRGSSKFSLQLFQIEESVQSVTNSDEGKKSQRQTKPYTRGDSTNSYLSERKTQTDGSAPASIGDPVCPEPKLVKRQSVAKLFGARPVPMVRRSSFPALPLNPDVQALMLGHRQPSVDSDDEGDGRGRRVRIIRRY